MSTPILPQSPTTPGPVSLSLLAVCHDAELAAGHPEWAHLLDDDRPFYALATRANYSQDGAA